MCRRITRIRRGSGVLCSISSTAVHREYPQDSRSLVDLVLHGRRPEGLHAHLANELVGGLAEILAGDIPSLVPDLFGGGFGLLGLSLRLRLVLGLGLELGLRLVLGLRLILGL